MHWSRFDELVPALHVDITENEADTVYEMYQNNVNLALNQHYESDEQIDRVIRTKIQNNLILTNLMGRITPLLYSPSSFAKMHLSPKDALWFGEDGNWQEYLNYLECKTAEDILLRFVKSQRIADCIDDYQNGKLDILRIYIKPWNPPPLGAEWRVFVWNDKHVDVKPMFSQQAVPLPDNWRVQINIDFTLGQHCIDIMCDKEGKITIIEYNPLDETTDMYE